MAAERIEDSNITEQENLRHGYKVSVALAGYCALLGAGMAEGIKIGLDNNLPATGIVAGTAVASAAAFNWSKHQIKNRTNALAYYDLVTAGATGPQVEGLAPTDYRKAIKDKQTVHLEVNNGKKSHIIPFLVPLKYAGWLNPNFFSVKGYDPSQMLYCVIPQKELAKLDPQVISGAIDDAAQRVHASAIVFDYLEGQSLFGSGDYGEVDELITSNKTPAATYHYRMHGDAKTKELIGFTTNPHVRDLATEDDIRQHFPRIWEIYQEQFQRLVDDHPIAGALKRDELLKVLLSKGSLLKAYFDDEDNMQSFGYMVSDISLCPWLNERYLKEETQNSPLYYFSGIASAPGYGRAVSRSIMNSFAYDALVKHGLFDITFECSNISAGYIPKLAELALKSSGIVDVTGPEEHKYYYNVLKLAIR